MKYEITITPALFEEVMWEFQQENPGIPLIDLTGEEFIERCGKKTGKIFRLVP